MQRRTKRAPATIEPPQLDAHLPLTQLDPADIIDGGQVARQLITSGTCAGASAEDMSFDQVVCRGVSFAQTTFRLAQLLDAQLDGCDLAGATWEKAHLQRVELLGCRLVGLSLGEGEANNLLLRKCNAELASFHGATLRASRFEQCVLRKASFEGATLPNTVFRGCDLSGADFRGARLSGVDLRGSNLAGIAINVADLRGVILDPSQLVHVAGLLGITVQAEDA